MFINKNLQLVTGQGRTVGNLEGTMTEQIFELELKGVVVVSMLVAVFKGHIRTQ